MDSNILLAIVIVAAAVAIIAFLIRHGKINAAAVQAAAAGIQSHVSGVVAGAQGDLQKVIATAALTARTKPPAAEVAGERIVDPVLSAPGAAVPTANTATAPPPASPAAADGAGSILTPAATVETQAQPAPIDAGSTQAAPAIPEHQLATAEAPAAAAKGLKMSSTGRTPLAGDQLALVLQMYAGQQDNTALRSAVGDAYVQAYGAQGSGEFYVPRRSYSAWWQAVTAGQGVLTVEQLAALGPVPAWLWNPQASYPLYAEDSGTFAHWVRKEGGADKIMALCHAAGISPPVWAPWLRFVTPT